MLTMRAARIIMYQSEFLLFVQRVYEQTQSKQLIQKLQDHGFDDWDQTIELTPELLRELGISEEHCRVVLNVIQGILNNQQPAAEKKADVKPLTQELLQKGLQKKKKDFSKKPPLKPAESIAEATVLSLNGLGLTCVTQCLQIAQSLQILQIYDNKLESLTLKEFQNLRILYAQNNLLTNVDIESLPNLEKVYLDKNFLQQLPVLPQRLSLVQISHQNTAEFQFPEEAFEQASYSLQTLVCESSNVDFVLTLGSLQNLETLNLRNNRIKEFDDIEDSLSALPSIKEIDLRGNPICQKYKYRDRIVLLCKTIECIDNKNVLQHERQFLINLGKQKILKRNQSLDQKPQKQVQPSINVKKEKIHWNDTQNRNVSKQINSSNNFKDLTPTLNTKHSQL